MSTWLDVERRAAEDQTRPHPDGCLCRGCAADNVNGADE